MGFGSSKAPPVQPIPLPPAASHPAVLGSSLSALSTNPFQKRAQAAAASTTQTSPQGLKTPVPIAKASLLGQ